MSASPPLRPDAKISGGFVLTQPFHEGPVSYNPSPHLAIDAVGYAGQAVRAVEAGRVFASSWNGDGWAIGGGNVIILEHVSADGKRYRSVYAHLQSRGVVRGQYVSRGQIIGRADSTGNSSGSHVHHAIGQYQGLPRDGGYRYLDPFRFMLALRFQNGSRPTGDLADNFRCSERVGSSVNLRSGATLSSPILRTTKAAEILGFLGTVQGSSVFGSRVWDRVWIPSIARLGFVHSRLGAWVP